MQNKYPKPYLKWPGNKYKLLPQIAPLLLRHKNRVTFIEPFAGSMAVSLAMLDEFYGVFAHDINSWVMSLHREVRSNPQRLIHKARKLFDDGNNKEKYQAIRARHNAIITAFAQHEGVPETRAERAAIFLYLNKHSFNGLIRYNQKGGFNVPFGNHKNPHVPEEKIILASERMGNGRVVTVTRDFRSAMPVAQQNDVVYCDPPYIPVSKTASFTCYAPTGGPFTFQHQQQLKQTAVAAAKRGANVYISNSDTPLSRELYADADEIHTITAVRSIAANGEKRGKVTEIVAFYGSGA